MGSKRAEILSFGSQKLGTRVEVHRGDPLSGLINWKNNSLPAGGGYLLMFLLGQRQGDNFIYYVVSDGVTDWALGSIGFTTDPPRGVNQQALQTYAAKNITQPLDMVDVMVVLAGAAHAPESGEIIWECNAQSQNYRPFAILDARVNQIVSADLEAFGVFEDQLVVYM